jgi:hydroxypyruvate reductase
MNTAYPQRRDHLLTIVNRAIDAVSPETAMHAAVSRRGSVLTVGGEDYDLDRFERIIVIGAGKASATMAHALEAVLGEDILHRSLHAGLVVTKYGHGLDLARVRVMESGHPVPDAAGQEAAEELLRLAAQATEKDLVLCLISGGASALIPAPQPPVTLAHKQAATSRLLECGATIDEINAVRKHLSAVKGGHLAKALEPATVISLIISDVVGDRLDVIGSGPTAPDDSSFADCLDILDKYALRQQVPAEIVTLLEAGRDGRAPETLDAGDSCFARVRNIIIAGNAQALAGAGAAARELGYAPVVVDAAMQGEARVVAAELICSAMGICDATDGPKPPVCLLAGGETTVTIKGNGTGGRNQEMALAAAIRLREAGRGSERISLACVGTDGTDGPTDAAGALVLPDTLGNPLGDGATDLPAARRSLDDNDAYTFFTAAGTILKTGPTRTNVMDITVILVDPA